jgi:outer membrane protein assembly factor BamB
MASAGDSSNNYAATPAVANGVVYAVANEGLFAFNAATGQPLWHTFSGAGTGGLTVANGVVYVDAGYLYAVNAATGQQLWSAPISSYFQAMAAVANGVVYKGGLDGFMYALDAATGQQIWQSALTLGSMGGAADVASGVVYEQSYNFFFAFDTGQWALDRTPRHPIQRPGLLQRCGSQRGGLRRPLRLWPAPRATAGPPNPATLKLDLTLYPQR